jgi:hypothetical protein
MDRCSICGYEFKDYSDLMEGSVLHITESGNFACRECVNKTGYYDVDRRPMVDVSVSVNVDGRVLSLRERASGIAYIPETLDQMGSDILAKLELK